MKNFSPLRYPGSKNKITPLIEKIITQNQINNEFLEAFGGGAGLGLNLLINGKIKKLKINELDQGLYYFWYSVLYLTPILINVIEKTEINIQTWIKAKAIYSMKNKNKRINTYQIVLIGSSVLILNRMNYNGILKGGLIGGYEQNGKYKMDSRFNKTKIINKIKLISQFKRQIKISNNDILKLNTKTKPELINQNKENIIYFDPPYYKNGKTLYTEYFNLKNHTQLAKKIKELKLNWILSYDNNQKIKKLYDHIPKTQTIEYNLKYSTGKEKKGKEIMFLSSNLKKPNNNT